MHLSLPSLASPPSPLIALLLLSHTQPLTQLLLLPPPTTPHITFPCTDGSYKRLWSDVYQLGTLACLRAGLLARNALYEGNAIAAIYRVLSSSDPAAQAPVTASHLLSILAALLQDVPAAFAAEGYAHLVYDAGKCRWARAATPAVPEIP
jgi:hypothetical protein